MHLLNMYAQCVIWLLSVTTQLRQLTFHILNTVYVD